MVLKLLKGSRLLNKVLVRNFSAEVIPKSNERQVFARRAATNDPLTHTVQDISKFYTVPKEEQVKLFGLYEFPAQFQLNHKTFNETAFMIRQPALEIINSLKTLDPTKPVHKHLLYGRWGDGKSMSMNHVVHFAYKSDFLLVHIPSPAIWLKWSREVCTSETKPGQINIPVQSAQFLKNFRNQNDALLQKLDLRITDEIVWSPREKTEKDSTFLELIDLGINRLKYAADVVDILLDEIKKKSTEQKCKTLVAIDGFNCFFNEKTHLRAEDRSRVVPQQITLVQSLLKLTKCDWTNGVVVVSVDVSAAFQHQRESFMPLYLLTKEGFEHLDPFNPILVPALSEKECNSLLDFYEEKKWLLKPEGRHEIEFLSTRNAFSVTELCGPY